MYINKTITASIAASCITSTSTQQQQRTRKRKRIATLILIILLIIAIARIIIFFENRVMQFLVFSINNGFIRFNFIINFFDVFFITSIEIGNVSIYDFFVATSSALSFSSYSSPLLRSCLGSISLLRRQTSFYHFFVSCRSKRIRIYPCQLINTYYGSMCPFT